MPAKNPSHEKKPGRIRWSRQGIKSFLTGLATEGLDPWHFFAAVFWGIFIGVVPIYGLQTIAALGIATLFKLNKPLTFGATFVNNPIFQPFLVFASIEAGHFVRSGHWMKLSSFRPANLDLKSQFADWVLGSLIVGLLLGMVAAFVVTLIFSRAFSRKEQPMDLPQAKAYVTNLFRQSPQFDRGFVRWKLRLDRIFAVLLQEDFQRGPVVDLGCGYGIVLALAAFRNPALRLVGCDLDRNRILVANQALRGLNAELSVADMLSFVFPEAGLILIMDVLQYLGMQDQQNLLERCCDSLNPQGSLIFRIPDKDKGLLSGLTMALDKIIFRSAGHRLRPTVLSPEEYEKILKNKNMSIEMRRITSRLPLTHILFKATKVSEDQN